MVVVVVRRDRGRVAAAVPAVGLEREVADAGRVVDGVLVVERDRVGHRLGLLCRVLVRGLRLSRLPGAVLGEHGVDLRPVAHGAQHLVAVDARAVALGLGDRVDLGAERRERLEHRLLEVGRPGVVAAPRVGYRDQGSPDVLGVRRVDAARHLAEPVVVVPHVQVADRHATASQLVGDEVRHQELAQVPQVHGPGRGDARGARDRPVGAGPLVMTDGVVRGAGHPVGGVRRGHGIGLLAGQGWVPNATGGRTQAEAWAPLTDTGRTR